MGLVLTLCIAGPAAAGGGEGRAAAPAWAWGRTELRSVQAGAVAVAGLRVEPSGRCAEQVRAELVEGRRRDEACSQDREAIGRALVRSRDAFGFVERRAVDLVALRMVLGVARRCGQWPLRSPDREVLRRPDVAAAGCRLRRYQGELPLVLVDRHGQRHEPLPPLPTDRDGRVELRFTAIDHALRVLGEGSLDDYVRIELGEEGWAGHVDLEQLLRFRADWHLTWLSQGRGVPGLFAVRHPGHPGADEARTRSAEALLARQARDYERVEAGELSPQAFLERHPQSPYRRRVESLVRARSMGAPGEAQPAGASASTGGAEPAGGGRRGGTSGGGGP